MPKADALLPIVSASDSDTSFFICIIFLWFFTPSLTTTGNESCNEFITTFDFFSWPAGCPLPSGGVSRCLQFISMRNRVNRHLLPGREAPCVRQLDGRFIRANCATRSAIEKDDDAFIRRVWQKKRWG